jgi:hypothetical protein
MRCMRPVKLKNLDTCFGIFACPAAATLLLVRTPFNAGFDLTIRYLAFPLLALVLFVAHASRKKNERHPWMRYFFALIIWPMLVVFSWPYLLVVNAAAADGSTLEVSGPVTEKFAAGSSRSKSYVIKLLDQATRDQVDVPISRSEWDIVKVGDGYKFCFFNGRFGVPYYWLLAGQPVCQHMSHD